VIIQEEEIALSAMLAMHSFADPFPSWLSADSAATWGCVQQDSDNGSLLIKNQ
jgi:hypothetical protein